LVCGGVLGITHKQGGAHPKERKPTPGQGWNSFDINTKHTGRRWGAMTTKTPTSNTSRGTHDVMFGYGGKTPQTSENEKNKQRKLVGGNGRNSRSVVFFWEKLPKKGKDKKKQKEH